MRVTCKNVIDIRCNLFANYLSCIKSKQMFLKSYFFLFYAASTPPQSVLLSLQYSSRTPHSPRSQSLGLYHAPSCLGGRSNAQIVNKQSLSPRIGEQEGCGLLCMQTGLIFPSSCILSHSHPKGSVILPHLSFLGF